MFVVMNCVGRMSGRSTSICIRLEAAPGGRDEVLVVQQQSRIPLVFCIGICAHAV